jgi:TniQ
VLLQRELLPCRVSLADGESLDGFLERLASANGLLPSQLLRLLAALPGSAKPTMAFLMFKPDPVLIDRVTRLSGVERRCVENATLARFGSGLPFHLDGFHPCRRHSFRQVVAQGWFPQFGSQVCPECVAHEGIWRVVWRLPILAVCVHHGVFLTTQCAGCGKRFRTHRHSPLRPIVGPSHPCGNPIGLRNPCRHSVLAHVSRPAPPDVIDAAQAVEQALGGQPVYMLGGQADPRLYLAELRHVATLLLHLLGRPGGSSFVDWAGELHREAVARTTQRRGPRWGISPPHSAVLRGNVLAEAHQILSQPSLEDAATRLAPWVELIADMPNGPSGWLMNRTKRTATMEQLITATVADHHHVGRRLDRLHCEQSPPTAAIPQLIDADIYHEFFGAMLGGYEWTGRMYVSLCLVRAVTHTVSWSDAAMQIGLDPGIGVRTARAASLRMQCTAATFAHAVDRVKHVLPGDRDFRRRESRVRALAAESCQWYETWRTSMTPSRRLSSLPHAVTWMWCEVAQGSLDGSPTMVGPPRRAVKAAYRAFCERLAVSAQDALRSLVLSGALA